MLQPNDREPITAEQIMTQFSNVRESIEKAVLKRAEKKGFDKDDVSRIIQLLNDKVNLLSEGLLPIDDYSHLSGQIDYWLGMAEAVALGSEAFFTTEKVIRRSLVALQGNMVANRLLSEEAKQELVRRWPEEEFAAE